MESGLRGQRKVHLGSLPDAAHFPYVDASDVGGAALGEEAHGLVIEVVVGAESAALYL